MSTDYFNEYIKLSQQNLTATFVQLCYDGNLEAISCIIDNKQLLEKINQSYHNMAFIMACGGGHIDIVKKFHTYSSSLSFSLIDGCESACYKNQKHIIEYLLNDTIVQSNLDTLFNTAFSSGKHEIVKLILTSDGVKEAVKSNIMGTGYQQYNAVVVAGKLFNMDELLVKACERNDLAMVKFLLLDQDIPKNADIHFLDDRALIVSCDKGHINIAKFLLTDNNLKEHANIHADNNQALKNSVLNDNLELVKYLTTSLELKEHADIHTYHDIIFRSVLRNDSADIAHFLLTDSNLKYHIDITESIEWIYHIHYEQMNDDDEYQYEVLRYIVEDYKYIAPNSDSDTLFVQILKSVPELYKLYETNKLANELNKEFSNNLNKIESKKPKL
jgi:hypothetical protein